MTDVADNSNIATPKRRPSPRRSVLDLAPLELDCMNTLWPLGEGTVRDIRDRLAERRPRAYTTIMTIMDRLTRKGVVERHKSGRAYIYRPHLTMEEARAQALGQVIDNFFAGSTEALLAQLESAAPVHAPRALAASVGASSSPPSAAPCVPLATDLRPPSKQSHSAPTPPAPEASGKRAPDSSAADPVSPERIDDTLL
jgi:predicted transcriptional regulator